MAKEDFSDELFALRRIAVKQSRRKEVNRKINKWPEEEPGTFMIGHCITNFIGYETSDLNEL